MVKTPIPNNWLRSEKDAGEGQLVSPNQEEKAVTLEYPTTHKVHYLTSERAVNDVLRAIQDGVIGFDTEYKHRDPTVDEVVIEHLFANVPGSKRSGLLVWQVLQTKHGERFDIKWDNIGLIRALPQELERVLESHDITKAGVGIAADLGVVWNDLGCNINNAVDCGLMAKLKDPHRYKNGPFANLSLEQSVSDVLGFDITKDLQKSNWKGDANGDISEEQRKYAAIDAHASLRLYEELAPALDDKAREINKPIPRGWYTFNGRFGYTMRTESTIWEKDALWSTADCTWFFGGKFQGYFP
ncbi:ribonuclease H-like domain-containing protein [Mycena vitilis]|nr:ribonuclease H-like domain-containing protein [Mycena vitilis]